ncbi:hypothetical protein IFR04_012719 [Cadophora malorum]|uniref:Uncharacterized protein n=1 Tax=Cadophora malorum TaxID=108018 RepID=A0A8H7T8C6_9HELO|nr:hypothetical protein IFR04_012719 [Cadophora malorum]
MIYMIVALVGIIVSNACLACHAAIILSLVFSLGQKLCLYLFLVERTHGVQANARPRKKDYAYLAGLAFVLVGFSAMGLALFMFHIDTFNITTGIYQIGIARPVASALLIWDVFVNIFLTAVFVRHCKPYMVKGLRGTCLYPAIKGLLKKITHRHRKKLLAGGDVAIPISQDALIRVIRKAFWVCLGILASTATNFSLLLYWAGKEEAWFFFTLCTIDVTWARIILHW